jgi:hypothetical protein
VRRPDLLIAVLRALLVVASLCWLPCARAPLGHADDLSEFEAARGRYDRHDYARAVDAFRKLVGSEPPRIANALLVLESRKYYAASLLFVGAESEARQQFRLLLQQEPSYALDPLAFPTEVVALFDEVKLSLRRDLDSRREAELQQQQEAARQAATAEQLRRHNLDRLRRLAEERVVRSDNSRWVATVPFGVGQFQNGHRGLGVALAMAEGLAAATSAFTFIGQQSLAGERVTAANRDSLDEEQRRWVTANIASFSAFAVLALVGIVDAHLRFVPGRVTTTPRPLPPDLDRWVRDEAKRVTSPPTSTADR